ncbi:MAG TPA: baseplate J/gp47 family protein [Candidatus Saccharibacteria bacterium]|nr:baseplate J/gp47 family protein [Candidatus Saccharibacteria bacterium]
MKKDVIYIDAEDDITAIISRVNASKEKIVALVPPKHVGVLQSAVNLRLLARAAKQDSKHLVLITNNHALAGLAAAASLPVAKNLQSKPEIAAVPTDDSDDSEDIIDGNDIPVGEHAGLPTDVASTDSVVDELSKTDGAGPIPAVTPRKGSRKKSSVPNFNTFRKKLALGVVGAVALITFLVWAIVIAPRATVVIQAKTSDESINTPITARTTGKTDFEKLTIKASEAKKSEKISQEFTPTGKKNIGEKATGEVEFSTSQISALGTTIPAGTVLTSSGGLKFVTDNSVTITISNYTGAPTTVTASENGAKFNAATGAMSGAPSNISANLTGPTSGGTDKNVKVVTASDVQRAKEQLVSEGTDQIESDLKSSFEGDVTIFGNSFKTDYKDVVSSPAIGAEVTGDTAKLTGSVVYRMYGVEKAEMNDFLDQYLKNELKNNPDQQVYDNGAADASFQDDEVKGDTISATLIDSAAIGPKIDENDVKEQSRGKKFGAIQEDIESIQGVENVEVNFFPFWVSTVPNDVAKIKVEFKLDEQK